MSGKPKIRLDQLSENELIELKDAIYVEIDMRIKRLEMARPSKQSEPSSEAKE